MVDWIFGGGLFIEPDSDMVALRFCLLLFDVLFRDTDVVVYSYNYIARAERSKQARHEYLILMGVFRHIIRLPS